MPVDLRPPARSSVASLCAIALLIAPGRARGEATDAAQADVQARYEGCLADLDAGATARAAECLDAVYRALVVIDPNTRADLYYVLADTVMARRSAAAADPIHLCRAKALIDDYLERERLTQLVRFRRKVITLGKEVGAALERARLGAPADPCAAPPPPGLPAKIAVIERPLPNTPATPRDGGEPTTAAADPPTRAEDPGAEDPGDAGDHEGAAGDADHAAPPSDAASPRPKSAPRPPAPTRASARKLGLQASTALMDAGFVTTIAGAGVTGLGAAFFAADLECAEGPPRCPEATPPGFRDAGLALMSIGGAALFVGIVLRWADQRRLRKLRPRVGGAAGPISVQF